MTFTKATPRSMKWIFVVAAALALAACGGGNTTDSKGPTLTNAIGAEPTASAATTGAVPMQLTFTAANPRGNIAAYEWDFKDNTPIAAGPTVQHTFMAPGTYAVTLTVRDRAGNFNRASASVVVSAANPECTKAQDTFASTVWPAMSATCTACHIAGGPAGGSALVLTTGSAAMNYNAVAAYAKKSGDLLLSKTIGLPAHTGAAPFGSVNDQRYKDLAALLPALKTACDNSATPVAPEATFWSGVTFTADYKVLARAAVLFAGRNPTAAEEAAVAMGGAPVLRQTIRGYMQGRAFDAFLDEAGETHFLTRGSTILGDNGYTATDWPAAANIVNNTNLQAGERNRFIASARAEPIELMKYIVNKDKPWTDMVAGKYTMVNAILAQYLQATVTGTFADPANDTVYLPGTLPSPRGPAVREHAGVLSTQAWLSRFPTTPTNRNRHRIYIASKQFLATDVTALAMRPIEDGGSFKVPVVENPNCSVCHNVIDPMAAGFQNWQENNRYLPNRDANGNDIALPASYRAANYPKDANNQPYYKLGDNWFRDEKAPGYGNVPMPGGVTGNPNALQWLGQQMAEDARFSLGAVHFWFKAVVGRDPLRAPLDVATPENAARLAAFNAQNEELQEIAARFRTDRGNGAFNVKDLLADILMSKWTRAEAASRASASRMVELGELGENFHMLNPVHLNRKLTAVVGQNFADFNNPYAGFGLNYGNFNGVERTTRPLEHTMLQSIAMDRLVATRVCSFVQNDLAKTASTRLLLPLVTLADTPATAAGQAAIQANIQYLHKWLWKDEVPVSDADVQRTFRLFNAVWADRATASSRPLNCAYNNTNDPDYTARAWAAVLAYMLGDPQFLFE